MAVDCVPDQPCLVRTGQRIRFTDRSTGTVRIRRWDFGDGRTSRVPSPTRAWRTPGFYTVSLTVSDGGSESEMTRTFLVEAAEPAGACVAGDGTRCLLDSRFAVGVEWRAASGAVGLGRVVPAGTNDSGLFRFFDPENWEVLVKVLDGCGSNGHFWVFAASTTDLGYTIRVTDTANGRVREYFNEVGAAAAAVTEAKAFTCGMP